MIPSRKKQNPHKACSSKVRKDERERETLLIEEQLTYGKDGAAIVMKSLYKIDPFFFFFSFSPPRKGFLKV